MLENTFCHRVLHKLAWALLLPACLAWGSWRTWGMAAAEAPAPAAAPELPAQWNGQPLRPLALSEVEARFARQFPGSLARLTDGREVLILRTVLRPTRMLHPAADCYQGLGWRVGEQRLQLDRDGATWRCFEVERQGRRQRVCERIVDADGRGFTDASSWYWAAVLGQSHGPWQAFTVAGPL
ncbi:MAG TPA: hypothetical protein VFE82_09975 [Ramlibacter sp.]|jgi:hypothetical protein|uniref:hypothetical protein n=1 Tax=Ramlibacter sp. TaxID=1917967 RepID=UPI002D59707B|nr:hypothetical protein [Ramlibacter sp.]HZY18800.1 hypothetical protein [Ramlibacter sp.]